MKKLTPKQLDLLAKCDGKHKTLTEILTCDSCEILLKDNEDIDTSLYYTAPPETAFQDMKRVAIAVWNTYDNEYGYVDEKVNQIAELQNVKDNFMYIFAMFDVKNQRIVVDRLKVGTQKELLERMKAGGNTPWEIGAVGL